MSWLITGTQKVAPTVWDPYFLNTSLLLHGNLVTTSTNIVDSSPSPKTVTPVDNAQISTAIADPFGNSTRGVLAFDGNGDYATVPVSSNLQFGTGDFTVEAFFYFNSFATGKKYAAITLGRGANANSTFPANYVSCGWCFYIFNNTDITFIRNDASATYTLISRSTTIGLGAWKHIAITRSGSTLRMFVDGSQLGASATSALSLDAISTGGTQDLHIGKILTGNSSEPFEPGFTATYVSYMNGYIDDLRITKGVARYTANFTPPTAPFPDI